MKLLKFVVHQLLHFRLVLCKGSEGQEKLVGLETGSVKCYQRRDRWASILTRVEASARASSQRTNGRAFLRIGVLDIDG